MVIFSILVHQRHVLNTKKLVIPNFLVLEKSPKNVLKTPQIDICSLTSLGCPQDVSLMKKGFYEIFSIFLDSEVISDIAEPK